MDLKSVIQSEENQKGKLYYILMHIGGTCKNDIDEFIHREKIETQT